MAARDGVVYLDFAATAAVRPAEVITAITEYLTHNGATPGRGGHRLAIDADRIALHTRQAIAKLLDIPGDPGRIAFFPSATYAINTALQGVLRSGDRVVTTVYDHNAVLRPVHALVRERVVESVMVDGDATGALDMESFTRAVDGARLVVLNGASNVLGTVLDVKTLTQIAHDAGALVLVDAAQVAGEVPFSVHESGTDLVAFTGHKGLLGPQGTGGLWVKDGVQIEAVISGGTGGDSTDREMPVAYPDHLEAGSQNGVGIAGLGAGARWLIDQDVSVLHGRTTALVAALRAQLAEIRGVRVLSPDPTSHKNPSAPIVTFVAQSIDPTTLALRLDREFGILARAGLHCAPEVHRLLGTERSGAVRFSAGWSTTAADITAAIHAVETITGEV